MSKQYYPARCATLLIALLLIAQTLFARDVFLFISGGGSIKSNNYSQYLQARVMQEFLARYHPQVLVWTFFGAGNVTGELPTFCDVRRQVQADGLVVETWFPGSLAGNRPAKRAAILRALRAEILPAVADGGTLYLFVGDHGSRTPVVPDLKTEHQESLIDLWRPERHIASPHGWRENNGENLGVAELRQVLAKGIGKGRIVFCMTQCYSGGFHHLSVPRVMTPNYQWFPALSGGRSKRAADLPALLAAGMTSTNSESIAAGCYPHPHPDTWEGYERYLPESLSGMNVFTLQATESPRSSFYAAHVEAVLIDQTVDKPRTTSELYLERWASLIDTRLLNEPKLTPVVRQAVRAYQRTVDGTIPGMQDEALRERQFLFSRYIQKMTELNPQAKALLLNGTRRELEAALAERSQLELWMEGKDAEKLSKKALQDARKRTQLQRERHAKVTRAWRAAIERNTVAGLPSVVRDFEKHYLEEDQEQFDLSTELFWHAGYGDPKTADPQKGEVLFRWFKERNKQIFNWAKICDDVQVRAVAQELSPTPSWQAEAGTGNAVNVQSQSSEQKNLPRSLDQRIAAERVLFYRRVLAAWQFLLIVGERPALLEIQKLTELERTPFPLFSQ